MLKRTSISLAAASLIVVGLVGCGGSSSGGNTSNGGTSLKSISGNVADGYLVGANVCLDLNLDNKCNNNEPETKTKKNGVYTISGITQEQINNYPLVVEVDEMVIDEDDGKNVKQYYSLSAPSGYTFISPISTMIRNYEVDNKTTVDNAKKEVQKLLGVTDDSLMTADYVASSMDEAKNVHKKAKIIANLKMEILTQLGDGIAKTEEARVVEKYINRKVFEQLGKIKSGVDSTSLDLNENIQNIMGLIDLTSSTSDFAKIKNDFKKEDESKNNNGGSDSETTPPKTVDQIVKELSSQAPTLITNSKAVLQQGVKYRNTYKDGVQLSTYTIANSVKKRCTVHTLKTTNAVNTYSEVSFFYDYNNDYKPADNYLMPYEGDKNAPLSLGWMLYSTGFVDFGVTCVDYTPPVQLPFDEQIKKDFGLTFPEYTENEETILLKYGERGYENYENEHDQLKLEQSKDIRSIRLYGNQYLYTLGDYFGLSVRIGGKVYHKAEFKKGDAGLEKYENFTAVSLSVDKETKKGVLRVLDKDNKPIFSTALEDINFTGTVAELEVFIATKNGVILKYHKSRGTTLY